MRRARTLLPAVVLLLVLALAGCSDDDSGDDAGSDDEGRAATIAALVESGEYPSDGEQLYRQSCASCHGGDGQGGVGPQLAGVVEEKYTPTEHTELVLSGKGAMPAFGSTLGDDEIAAIVAYERTGLGEG
jgi:mono/diheme cytochrome c family protein